MRPELNGKKMFNIGLTLETSLHEYIRFLDSYKEYIQSVYFSLPLGDRFQTRKKISQQFQDPKTRELFWDLLYLLKENNINIELVLNTYTLNSEDIENSKVLLDGHGITVDSISILDDYYDEVTSVFPKIPLVYSFNNQATISDEFIAQRLKLYDCCVLGRSYLRDNATFNKLSAHGIKNILLLNNGCSFNCSTCFHASLCKKIFMKNLKEHNINYLYALQSIMPFELYDGTLNLQNIHLFKISNRSSGIGYLQKCIDSYLNNEVLSYITNNIVNFSLWCRLGHFYEYYADLSLDEIIKNKEIILGHKVHIK